MSARSHPSLTLRDRAVGALARAADRALLALFPPAPRPPATVRRILVVKPCCLGDVLMATPAIRALATAYPDAEIDALTTRWSAPALEGNPRVTTVLPYPERPSPWALLRLARRLRRRGYDLGVGLDRSPVVNALLALTGIPIRAGVDNLGRGVGLSHRARPEPGQHETDLFLAVLAALGIAADDAAPEYHPTRADREWAANWAGDRPRPIVVLHPGGAVNPGSTLLTKRWPPERFAALAERLVAEWGGTVVLVGAASDREAVEQVLGALPFPAVDLAGRLSLSGLAALCEQADLYVGNDSGTTHLAAAVGTPTVAIFGPTSPRRYRPRGARSVACAPEASWTTGTDADLRRAGGSLGADIRLVSVDEVASACLEALSQGREVAR